MSARDEVARLLQAQAADFDRLRALTQAQLAVLTMDDAALLEKIGREADEVVVAINGRNALLARYDDIASGLGLPTGLTGRVERARNGAVAATGQLSRELEAVSRTVLRHLTESEREREWLTAGYGPSRPAAPGPVRLDSEG